MTTNPKNDEQLREAVRERYGRTALEVLSASEPKAASCCGADCCGGEKGVGDAVSSDLYSNAELGELPLAAALASLGCGNPTALAALKPGRRVGPTGFAYGLDMTDAMLELAERNRAEAGVENVRFLKGVIEDIPLPANSVDLVISNCVINLSADKRQVLREAYRILVPGGRFAVSDIVFQGHFPQAIRADLEAWAGCIAGALEEEVYRQLLAEVGFADIDVEVTRRYALNDIAESGAQRSIAALSDEERAEVDGKFVSAFIRARKPKRV